MPKFKIRPYDLLLVAPVAVYFAGQPQFGFSIDLYLFDTYFMLEIRFLTWLLIFAMALCWIVYSLTKRLALSGFLVWTHVLSCVILSISILVSLCFFQYSDVGVAGAPRRYFDYSTFSNFQILGNRATAIRIMLVLLLLAQLIFTLNITIGLFTSLSKTFARQIK